MLWDPFAEFETAVLPNGLTVHVAHWPNRPLSINFVVHSGAGQDKIGLEGTAHFVEHLVSKNAPVSYEDLKKIFNATGGSIFLGSTSYDSTQYGFRAPTDTGILKNHLSLFGEMLLKAQLTNYIERERNVILGEFDKGNKIRYLWELEMERRKNLFKGFPLERSTSPLGYPEAINLITQRQLQDFYNTHYTPSNMTVVAVGGMNLSELVQILSDSPFGDMKAGSRAVAPQAPRSFDPMVNNIQRIQSSTYLTEKSSSISYHFTSKVPIHVSEASILLVSDVLGYILDQEFRQRSGWTYQISTSRSKFPYLQTLNVSSPSISLSALNEFERTIETCIKTLSLCGDFFERFQMERIHRLHMVEYIAPDLCRDAVKDVVNHGRIVPIAELVASLQEFNVYDMETVISYLRPEYRWTVITTP